ncbi:unnamed protein product [Symbiodinium sp. KB8]|nr:unnamed protein product [Symbiodinium sp. KB8]
MHIKSKVEEAKDETEIVVTIPKTFMTPGSEERTTYYEWESKKADEAKSQVFQGGIMVVVLSFAMGVHVPLVMQLFMRPLQVFQQPLVRGRGPKPVPDSHLTFPPPPTPQIKKYLLGSKDKVWKERLVTEAAAQDTSGLESFILEQWEKNEAIDMAKVKQGVETDGWDLNYQTSEEGWTLLMIVCGTWANSEEDVCELIKMGCDPTLRDNEGWSVNADTPINRAAVRGVLKAVDAAQKLNVLTSCIEPPAEEAEEAEDAKSEENDKEPEASNDSASSSEVATTATVKGRKSIVFKLPEDEKAKTPVDLAALAGNKDLETYLREQVEKISPK